MKRAFFIACILPLALICFSCAKASLTGPAEPPKPAESAGPPTAEAAEEAGRGELQSDIDAGYLILVNKTHGLEKGYKPADLTAVKYYAADRRAEGRLMRAAAAEAFDSMAEMAKEQGLELVVTTAYRSYDFQAELYEYYVAQDGQAAADRYSAKPGYSEHQTGLAADISSASVGYKLTESFADTEEGKWLAENARLFGFIMRYPEGLEETTGYQYEPWHIRYVGCAAADYIYSHDIALEEYLNILDEETEE